MKEDNCCSRTSARSSLEPSVTTLGDSEPFLLTEDGDLSKAHNGKKKNRYERLYLRTSFILIVAATAFGVAGNRYPIEKQCVQTMSTWSPMLGAVEHEWRHFKTEEPNIYYGTPNAQLEAAWDKLWQCEPFQ